MRRKRSAIDSPDTSDDDGSQLERGKEAEAAGPQLDHAERQKNKKLRQDGEAGSVGNVNEKVSEKLCFGEACDAVAGEAAGQGLSGEGSGAGGEKLDNKRNKEAKHNQGSFEDSGKEEAVAKRKRPCSEEDNEAQKEAA